MVMFPNHKHVLLFDEWDHIIGRMMWWTWPFRQLCIMIVLVSLLLLSSWLIQVPQTMRLCNSRIPEEHFVCYQNSQRKWVIIKVLYRCLQKCLLGWHRSRLGFVTPCFGEVSLGPSVILITISPASIVTNELVAGWRITKWIKRLASN